MSENVTGSVSESGSDITWGASVVLLRLNTDVDFDGAGAVKGRASISVFGGSRWQASRTQGPFGPFKKLAASAVVPVPTFSEVMSRGLASMRVSPCLRRGRGQLRRALFDK